MHNRNCSKTRKKHLSTSMVSFGKFRNWGNGHWATVITVIFSHTYNQFGNLLIKFVRAMINDEICLQLKMRLIQ